MVRSSKREDVPEFRLDPTGRKIFMGLLLGMFVSSISQTIVGPAIPRIVAELGGMEHYSWLATTSMLVMAVSVPIIGKLSDLYGRRLFFLGGLAVFMLGSMLSGAATNFWFLVSARALQGLGMGALQPLSQTIVGDIIPPRYRGKYQGIMGAVFGVSSVAGPLAGGYLTDQIGWRWLFYVAIPVGLIAFWFMYRNFHPDQEPVEAKVDYPGIGSLTVALVAILMATSFGGVMLPWASPQVIGLYAVGVLALVIFVLVERRAEEPVIPLRLFTSSVFTLSNLANLLVAMMMFGTLVYVPVFAQGAMGMNAAQSGAVLMPMSVAMILTSMAVGALVSWSGRYKGLTLAGIVLMGTGMFLLTRLTPEAQAWHLAGATVLIGIGLGASGQMYTLIVQNIVMRRDLGVATATTQFFRSAGGTVGVAVFGTIFASRMGPAVTERVAATGAAPTDLSHLDAGSVLDPSALAGLPEAVAEAIRLGLGEALTVTFGAGVPIALVALVSTALVKNVPLRTTLGSPEDGAREMLDSMSQTADGGAPAPRFVRPGERTRERILGLKIALLSAQSIDPEKPYLRQAVERIGDGDLAAGRAILEAASTMLMSEDPAEIAASESAAVLLSERGKRPEGVLGDAFMVELAVAASRLDEKTTRTSVELPRADRVEGVDMSALRAAVDQVHAAVLVDMAQERLGYLPHERVAQPESGESQTPSEHEEKHEE